MKGRTEAIIWIAFVAAAVGIYAVCRRPESGPEIGLENTHRGEPPAGGPQGWSPDTIGNETLRSTVSDLIARWDEADKLRVVLSTEMPEAAGMEGKTKGRVFYWHDYTGRVPLRRLRVVNMFEILKEGGVKLVTNEDVTKIYDGEYFCTLINQPKSQTATKSEYREGLFLELGGAALFETLFEDYDITLEGDETVGEWKTYVFAARPKDGSWTSKYWFDKATGVQVQLIESTSDGSPQLKLIADIIEVDPEIAEGMFTFVVPDGFTFIDETIAKP